MKLCGLGQARQGTESLAFPSDEPVRVSTLPLQFLQIILIISPESENTFAIENTVSPHSGHLYAIVALFEFKIISVTS